MRAYSQDKEQEFAAARERLEQGLAILARRPSAPARLLEPEYADNLMTLMRLTLERNEVVNLTAVTEPAEFAELHLLDSLACCTLPAFLRAERIVDVGSGAGFPALPLALLCPEKTFLLTDALRKRVEFISFAAETLGAANVGARHVRAETLGRDASCREGFDLALCRAVGKLPVIMEYALPLTRIHGAAFFFKTARAEAEIEDSALARKLLGGGERVEVFFYRDVLPARAHAIYIVQKERPTPKTYPRKEGLPAKVPLMFLDGRC